MSQARNEATNLTNAGFATGTTSLPHDSRPTILTTFTGHRSLALATPIDDDHYPPLSAPNQESKGQSDFIDGSGPIFSMYLEMAEEEDKKMAESWKADAESILVFVRIYLYPRALHGFIIRRLTGLFSAAVASLICVRGVDSGHSTEPTGHL
jgi:hypothetical protein